jgi:hypothetical protein
MNHLERQIKSGHREIIGETIAKLKLFDEGFNVYSRFLDIEGIDFIVRRRKGKKIRYIEIQMKYSRPYHNEKAYWYGIQKGTFEARQELYYMFICGDIEKIFIVPSSKLKYYLLKFNQDEKKWHIHIKEDKNMWYFLTKAKYKHINITEYLNSFKQIKA